MRKIFVAAWVACCLSQPALAAFDLQVTEMWPGNEPGDNQTEDWFEVTNFGDTEWTSTDGTLYFDDSSPDVANADEMFGISSIAPGETVIYIDHGSLPSPAITIGVWTQLWTTPLTDAGRSIPQIGYYSGSGLSGGGDEVNLWLDTDMDLQLTDIIDTEGYNDADSRGGRSWDAVIGQFSRSSYSVVTGPNGDGNPSTGTPGYVEIVPEPSSLVITAVGIVGLLLGARRK